MAIIIASIVMRRILEFPMQIPPKGNMGGYALSFQAAAEWHRGKRFPSSLGDLPSQGT